MPRGHARRRRRRRGTGRRAWRVRATAVTPGMTVAVGASSRGLDGRVELLRGHDRRPPRPAGRTVRRAGDGQPRRGDGRRAAGHAGRARHHRSHRRCRDPGDDGDGGRRRRPRRRDRRRAAAPRSSTPPPPTRSCAVNRDQAAHRRSTGRSRAAAPRWSSSASASSQVRPTSTPADRLGMRDQLLAAVSGAARRPGGCSAAMASVESAGGDVVAVEALRADDVGGPGEVALMELARSLAPRCRSARSTC